jgi:tetratricopeptide (TPR) repeat protein
LGQVLGGQFVCRLVRAQLDQAEHHAEELRELGEARNETVWKCFSFARSGTACTWQGKFIEARAYFENYLSLWNPTYRAFWRSPEDLWVGSLLDLSRTLLCLGHIDQALLRQNQALAEARRLSPFSLVHVLGLGFIGDWAIGGVRWAEAMLRSTDELLAASDEHGFPFWLSIGNVHRGWCLGAMGLPAAGIPMVLQGLGLHRATGATLSLPFWLTTLAELHGMAGQPDEGLNLIAEALVATSLERWAEAEIHRVRGTLFLLMNRHAAAEDSFRRAIIVAQRQSAKFWELHAALDLARLWRDQGKRAEARDLLAPIYAWFSEGFDTPVLQDAKALLDELV